VPRATPKNHRRPKDWAVEFVSFAPHDFLNAFPQSDCTAATLIGAPL
jgi:hypothetical protein